MVLLLMTTSTSWWQAKISLHKSSHATLSTLPTLTWQFRSSPRHHAHVMITYSSLQIQKTFKLNGERNGWWLLKNIGVLSYLTDKKNWNLMVNFSSQCLPMTIPCSHTKLKRLCSSMRSLLSVSKMSWQSTTLPINCQALWRHLHLCLNLITQIFVTQWAISYKSLALTVMILLTTSTLNMKRIEIQDSLDKKLLHTSRDGGVTFLRVDLLMKESIPKS